MAFCGLGKCIVVDYIIIIFSVIHLLFIQKSAFILSFIISLQWKAINYFDLIFATNLQR